MQHSSVKCALVRIVDRCDFDKELETYVLLVDRPAAESFGVQRCEHLLSQKSPEIPEDSSFSERDLFDPSAEVTMVGVYSADLVPGMVRS